MDTLALLIGSIYAITTLVAVLIIIYLIIKKRKKRSWKILKREIIANSIVNTAKMK